MESWCIKAEPKVINDDMIQQSIDENARPGEAGRLQKLEGIPLTEVYTIRFELKKILRIDHLWVLPSLVKLSLNNNLIEKIENLEMLVNLKELNLSFNKISKIENLDTLTNLEVLNLFENKIKLIENVHNLKKLIIFSIGRNFIEDRKNIFIFRRFKHLKSLNMTDNPCAGEEDFRSFVATFLPQLTYYEYKRILPVEREEGKELFEALLNELEEKERDENIRIAKKEKALADAEKHSVSFVEYLGDSYLFDSMFENDVEGNLFFLFGTEITDFYDEFKEEFVSNCVKLFEFGQEQYVLREDEVKQYESTVEAAKKEGKVQSIRMMEEFLEKKNEVFEVVLKLGKDFKNEKINEAEYLQNIQSISETFNEELHEIWKSSMKFEVTIFGQMEEVNQLFELSLNDLINFFIENAQATFTVLRTLQATYNDNVTDFVMKFMGPKGLNPDADIPQECLPMFSDKDTLANALGGSHDIHMQVIDTREDLLIARARKWLSDIVDNLYINEIKRNRMKILEISHFLDVQKEEFLDLVIKLNKEEQ